MNTEHIITRTQQHMTAIAIFMEDYLRNEIWKCKKQQDDKLGELRIMDSSAQIFDE